MHAIFWDSLVFLYFLGKNTVLSRIFKKHSIKIHPLYSFALALVAWYVNENLLSQYSFYLDLTSIKGSIQLPHFTLLFIIADFASSMVMVAFSALAASTHADKPVPRMIVDALRFIWLCVMFTVVTSTLWQQQLLKQTNWSYECFRQQIAIDLATYYFRHGGVPDTLSDFTAFVVNPANGSALLYTAGSVRQVAVVDQAGNTVLVGYKDLRGITQYENNPSDFFWSHRTVNRTVCDGRLAIPPEYSRSETR